MPSWNELLNEFKSVNQAYTQKWFEDKFEKHINNISKIREGKAVIIYIHQLFYKSHKLFLPLSAKKT